MFLSASFFMEQKSYTPVSLDLLERCIHDNSGFVADRMYDTYIEVYRDNLTFHKSFRSGEDFADKVCSGQVLGLSPRLEACFSCLFHPLHYFPDNDNKINCAKRFVSAYTGLAALHISSTEGNRGKQERELLKEQDFDVSLSAEDVGIFLDQDELRENGWRPYEEDYAPWESNVDVPLAATFTPRRFTGEYDEGVIFVYDFNPFWEHIQNWDCGYLDYRSPANAGTQRHARLVRAVIDVLKDRNGGDILFKNEYTHLTSRFNIYPFNI